MTASNYIVVYPCGAAGTFIANLVIAALEDCDLGLNSNGSMDFTNPAVSNLKINQLNADTLDTNNIIITNCVDMAFLKLKFNRQIINVSFNANDVENICQLYWLKTIKDNPKFMNSWPDTMVHLINKQQKIDLNDYDFLDQNLNYKIFKFGYNRLINYHLRTTIPTENQIKFSDIFADNLNLTNTLSDILRSPISLRIKEFITNYRQVNWDLYPFLQTYKK